ncbi:MAG: nucleotidyltransferase substrate binding protein [Verrucomicrobiota bacterium]|nr:nucleotidyltransferase substrate binding protein [Verrucomicrobiota bacterium]
MAPDPDIRWCQRFANFRLALARLKSAATLARERELSDLEQQGLIKAFEFTHELAWNTMKDYVREHGSTSRVHGSRDATREAFALGIIENGDVWMKMIDHRHETAHAYDEKIADEIASVILGTYVEEFAALERQLAAIERET